MNKKFRVRSVEFRVHEDSYEHGEGNLMCIWTEENLPVCDTIEEALSKVPHLNELMSDGKKIWTNDPCFDNEFSRFDADALIDWNNNECPEMHVDEQVKENWKAGKTMLYNLHAIAYVDVISELSEEDVKDFVSAD